MRHDFIYWLVTDLADSCIHEMSRGPINCRAEDQSLGVGQSLQSFTGLTALALKRVPDCSEAMQRHVKGMPHLQKLTLDSCKGFSSSNLQFLGALTSLEGLNISGNEVRPRHTTKYSQGN